MASESLALGVREICRKRYSFEMFGLGVMRIAVKMRVLGAKLKNVQIHNLLAKNPSCPPLTAGHRLSLSFSRAFGPRVVSRFSHSAV